MKIYTRVVIDIESGRVLDETSYEYTGPVAQAGGGSTKATTNVKLDPYSIQMNQMRLQQEQAFNPYKRQALNQFGSFINPGYSVAGFMDGGSSGGGGSSNPNVDPNSPLGGLLKIYPGLSGSLQFTPDEGAFLEKWLGVSLPKTTTGKKKNAITTYDFPVPILFDQELANTFFKGAGINPETGELLNPNPVTPPTTGKRNRRQQEPALTFGQQIFPLYQKLTGLFPSDGTSTPGGSTGGGTTGPGGSTGGGGSTPPTVDPQMQALFAKFPGLASLKFSTPEQAFAVAEAARLTDTAQLENAAKSQIENVVGPQLLASLTASGLGRSGAIGQALGDAAAQFTLPIATYSTQARSNLANLIGQSGQQRQQFIQSLGAPSAPFFSSGSTTNTQSGGGGGTANTISQVGQGLGALASLASVAWMMY